MEMSRYEGYTPGVETHENTVDDWLVRKPKWSTYLHRPVGFAFCWQRA